MKTKEFCNNAYRDLCAKLGELYLQHAQTQKAIEECTAQIALLNNITLPLQKLEQSKE
jgi:hypothetical protein